MEITYKWRLVAGKTNELNGRCSMSLRLSTGEYHYYIVVYPVVNQLQHSTISTVCIYIYIYINSKVNLSVYIHILLSTSKLLPSLVVDMVRFALI